MPACDCSACPAHGGSACRAPATVQVAVSTIPGSLDGKIVRFGACLDCYLATWRAVDLTGSAWERALRERDRAG